jgi:hypothetical protein
VIVMSGGRVALLVAGIVAALVGFGAAAAGAGLLWVHGGDGYVESPTWTLETDAVAVTAEEIELVAPTADDWWWEWSQRPDIQIDVASDDAPVFVGVGPRAEVAEYLRGVPRSEIVRLRAPWEDTAYRQVPGGAMPQPPGDQEFWVARTEGTGAQQLTWRAEPGMWALVVMNADGQPGVSVDASAAVQADVLLPLGLAVLIGGLVLLLAGVALVVIGAAGASTATVPAPGVPVQAPRPYPAAIEGRMDVPLSRWLWLVKWLLLIPHVVVLAFLWIAFVVLTAVAGVAILLTARYPRGIFDFNVGVIRWTWRVAYYGYSALGTDRYPPFTLDAVDYPATFDVAYPEHLSRGLVLVKWWLLAIPHYIIVGLLVGGGLAWTARSETWGTWSLGAGGGVIGVLVFVAALLLLFTARYPAGLFDIIMGLNRWVYRVLVYAALMTDEYPPFRLDLGGQEPQPAAPPPAGPRPAEAELAHR